MLAKGDDLVPGEQVLAAGKDKELDPGWLFLALLVADQDHHLADALDRRLQNGLNLPDAAVVVAPTGRQKGVDGLLGGRGRREICRIGLGKRGRRGRRGSSGRWRGRRGRILLGRDSQSGQGQDDQRNHTGQARTGKNET